MSRRPPAGLARCLAASLATALLAVPCARAQVSVRGSAVQEYAAAPGQTIDGFVDVTNPTAVPQVVRVYLTDYRFDADGATRYDAPGGQPRSNAGWITLAAEQVTLAPQQTAPVRYTVRVPAGAPLVGSYWSMLMVEGAPQPASGATGALALQARMRYGVQVVTHGAPGARVAEISPPHLAPAPAAGPAPRVVEFDLRNTGEHAYRPVVSLELFDAAGASRGTFRQERGLLYPGTSLRQRFELVGVPPNAYRAVLLVDAGEEQVFGADFALTP